MGGVFIATINTSRGVRWELRGLSRELFPPTMLFVLAFALATLVSVTTIAADFWIFPRQWIASTALAALAIFWAGHVLYRHASSVSRWRGIGSSIVLIAAFALPAAVVVGEQTRNLVAWNTRQIVVYPDDFELKRLLREEETISDSVWMKFAQENIDEMILDLRYNGGGLIRVAGQLSTQIAGAAVEGEVFVDYKHNDKQQGQNRTSYFSLGAGIEKMDLDKVVVLTSRGSCSASELVINALEPFINVVTVGDNTCGKPVGMYPTDVCDYVVFAINFETVNAEGTGGYFDGLEVD